MCQNDLSYKVMFPTRSGRAGSRSRLEIRGLYINVKIFFKIAVGNLKNSIFDKVKYYSPKKFEFEKH